MVNARLTALHTLRWENQNQIHQRKREAVDPATFRHHRDIYFSAKQGKISFLWKDFYLNIEIEYKATL